MKLSLNTAFAAALLATSFGAHALCVKPDGSLDDPSVSPEYHSLDVLPACGNSSAVSANHQPKSKIKSMKKTTTRIQTNLKQITHKQTPDMRQVEAHGAM